MSTVYFVSNDNNDDVEMSGSERAHMDIESSKYYLTALADYSRVELYNSIENIEDQYFKNYEENAFKESLFSAINTNSGGLVFKKDGYTVSSFALRMNTAFRMGSDPLKLMARIHAQCEINTYVKPENFEWLSGIVKEGLETGLYRKGYGWEDLIELLSCAESAIVTSFSVAEEFPNRTITNLTEEDWDKLNYSEQFNVAFKSLEESNKEYLLEMTPENWDDYYFESNISANDLERELKINIVLK